MMYSLYKKIPLTILGIIIYITVELSLFMVVFIFISLMMLQNYLDFKDNLKLVYRVRNKNIKLLNLKNLLIYTLFLVVILIISNKKFEFMLLFLYLVIVSNLWNIVAFFSIPKIAFISVFLIGIAEMIYLMFDPLGLNLLLGHLAKNTGFNGLVTLSLTAMITLVALFVSISYFEQKDVIKDES